MPTVAEAAAAKSQLAGDIAAGVNTLSLNQTVTFTKYVRLVLPLDGYVFWVRADLVSPSALLNAAAFNSVPFNKAVKIVTPAPTVSVQGSLHYSTVKQQNEDETPAVNQVVFTALSEIQDFQEIGPNVIFIATFQDIQFAFSQRQPFYQQADTYHYIGTAVLPAMQSQIIDAVSGFDSRQLIVSNSLPIWLSFNGYPAPFRGAFSNQIPLYPSFLIPDNLPPPYGAIHIDPAQTSALQPVPHFDARMSQWQLAHDKVRVTLYGLNNIAAQTFLAFVEQYMTLTNNLGLMNGPIIRDEKRTQTELNILAMKKTIEFDVSYYQTAARNIARQLITSAIVGYEPSAAG